MKKTDTCYYMSITKEENSAFVVANNQTVGADPSQVVVESKTDLGGMGSMGTTATNIGLTTTISTSSVAGGNGTALNIGAHRAYEKTVNTLYETPSCRQETCTGPGGQAQQAGPRAPVPPQVILQVLPNTPTPIQHLNLIASDVRRECRMRRRFPFFLAFSFLLILVLKHFSFYFCGNSLFLQTFAQQARQKKCKYE